MAAIRRILGLMVVGAASMAVVFAQSKDASADKIASEKVIIGNENKINEAVAKGDATAFKALVSSEGWSVEATGLMPVSEFVKNIKQFKLEPGWKITDTKVLWIASNSAVLTYKWTGKGTFMGQPIPPVTFASTVWHKNGDKWMAIFHQETPAAPGK